MGKNCLDEELPHLAMLQAHAQSTHKNASNAEHMGIPAHAHMQKLLTTRKHRCSLLLTLLTCI